MSEEIKNEEIIPATLETGEPLISQEQTETLQDHINNKMLQDHINESLIEKYEEAVEEVKSKIEPANVVTNVRQNISTGDGTVAGITAVENGVIGTGKVVKKPKTASTKAEPKVEKVAIHSTKNVTWNGVGKVYKGYNLVTPEQAEQWLTRSHIRTATPQEVAREFNK